ncbi:MAG: hypothetical protein NC548_55590 [Lachnospiraceae bacterium]|nr:hypothetical protein [Lachnospiraceae bacterium]MCM1230895.1 hypothetical protein [Ruminococcus flavefaciens]
MLIEKTNIFFTQHGIEKDVWSQMFCTTSRRTKSTKGTLRGKNEQTAPNINLFSKAIKGKHKITWGISDRDFADTLVTAVCRTSKTDFYNFCKENLADIPDIDADNINEEMIYNMICSLAVKIKAESFSISEYPKENSDCTKSNKSPDSDSRVKLLTNIKPCRSVFKGRDGLILQMYDHFQMRNNFLFLQGIGGIGKSECAKQYAEKYRNKYDVIVFAECPDSLVSSVNDSSIFALTEPFAPRQSIESDRQFYVRKMKQLRTIKEKTLLILDNVDYFSEDIDDFITLPFDMIITTRYDYFSEYPSQTIYINEIENMAILKDIFSEYYGADASNDPFTEKIINMFERHTMAIELVAKQAKASNLMPQEMFDIMNNNDEYEFQETFRVINYDSKQRNISGYMQKLFNIASLTEQEQYIMMCLSLLPITGMEKRIFKKCCGLKDYNIINKLIELSWIRDIDGKLSIHTLIKETVKISCKPDLIKCYNFINNLIQEYPSFKFYYGDYVYKEEVQRIAINLYNTFPEPEMDLWEFYEWLDLIFSHYSRHDISLQIAEKLYNLYKSAYGENHFRTARMIVRMGCAKRKYDDLEEAISLMEKGREIIVKLENRTERETLYISDIDVTLTNAFMNYYGISDNKELLDKNENFCMEAISIRNSLKDKFPPLFVTLVSLYRNLSLIECYRNNYEKAVSYLELAEKECKDSESVFIHSINDSIHSNIALAQGDIQKAAQYQKSAIEKHILCFSEYDISTINMKTKLGDIYLKFGDTLSAYEQYKNALEHLEKIPFKNTKMYSYLTEKIYTIKNK